MAKMIKFDSAARDDLKKGVDALAEIGEHTSELQSH